jgi:predicted permease
VKDRRIGKLLLTSCAAAFFGFWLSRALGVPPRTEFVILACFVLAAGGTVLLAYGKDGKLARPKLLTTIVAIAIATCIAVVALAWYAIAHSTDL